MSLKNRISLLLDTFSSAKQRLKFAILCQFEDILYWTTNSIVLEKQPRLKRLQNTDGITIWPQPINITVENC